MGWQDAPEVSSSAGTPAWASAPEVKATADVKPERGLIDKAGDWLTGGLESALHLASGTAAASAAGLAGMAAGGIGANGQFYGAPAGTKPNIEAAPVVSKVEDALTYKPVTPEGKAVDQVATYPFRKLGEGADAAGQKVTDVTGSPALGAAANTAIQAIPMAIAPAIKGIRAGVEAVPDPEGGVPIKTTLEEGQHVATSPNGKTVAMPRGNNIQIIDTETAKAAQGNGEGTARAATLADKASAQGGRLISDTKVSPAAAKVYDKLEAQGYTVTRNPATPDATGDLVSDTSRPVFEVSKAVATPAESTMSPEQLHAQNVDVLLKNDIPLTVGQRGTGMLNKQAASAGRAADSLAGTSTLIAKQKQAFTQAVMKAADLDAKNATPDAMAQLHREVSNEYEDLHDKVPTKLDYTVSANLDDTLKQAGSELDAAQMAPFRALVDDLKAKAQPDPASQAALDAYNKKINAPRGIDGQTGQPFAAPAKPPMPEINQEIAGHAAQNARSTLVRKQGSQDPSVKYWAGRFKDVLDDAFERSAPPADATRMQVVRQRFIKMKQIEDSVAGSTDGNISYNRLLSVLARGRNRGQSVYGRGDQQLVDLANAAKAVLPDAVGNSGTATRGADIGKIVAAVTNPIAALKVGGAVAGGRLLNERNPMRGTSTDLLSQAQKAADAVRALQQPTSMMQRATAAAAVPAETQEQQRQRMLLQALRAQ